MHPHRKSALAAYAVQAAIAALSVAFVPQAHAQWSLQGAPTEDVYTLCIGAVGDKVFYEHVPRGLHGRGASDTSWGQGDGLIGVCQAMVRTGSDLVVGYDANRLGRVWRLRKGAKNWAPVGVKVPLDRNLIPFGHAGDLYAATDTVDDRNGKGHDIFRLDTATDTWVKRGTLPAGAADGFASLGTVLYMVSRYYGFFLSRDSGATWSGDLRPPASRPYLTGITTAGDHLIFSSGSGLYRADADGTGWSPLDIGTPARSFKAVARSGTRVFAAGPDGLYRSDDNGKTWIKPVAPLTGPILRMSIGDAKASFLQMESKGHFATFDDGDTWTHIPLFQEPAGLLDLQASGGVLAGLVGTGITVSPLADVGRLAVSADRGRTWSADGPDSIVGIALRKEGVLAMQASGPLDLRKPDGTWERVSPGIPDTFRGEAVATPEGDLIAITWAGPWRFGDAAAGWVAIKGNLPDTLRFTRAESSGSMLFVESIYRPEGDRFRSADGGRTWTRCDSTYRTPYSIAGTGSVHLAMDPKQVLRRSVDNGASWRLLETLPKDSAFEASGVFARDGILHIGGKYGRVWTSRDQGLTWAVSKVDPPTAWIGWMAWMEGDFYGYSSTKGLYRYPGVPDGIFPRARNDRATRLRGPVRRGSALLFPSGSPGSEPRRRADGRLLEGLKAGSAP